MDILFVVAASCGAVSAFLLGRYVAHVSICQGLVYRRRGKDGRRFVGRSRFSDLVLMFLEGMADTIDLRSPKKARPLRGHRFPAASSLTSHRPKHRVIDEHVLIQAGVENIFGLAMLRAVQVRLASFTGALLAMPALLLDPSLSCLLFFIGIGLGYKVPTLWVSKEARRRREECEREVPMMEDIVSLASQAGMSFDAAFAIYARSTESLLANRCRHASDSYLKGTCSRDQALHGLADEWDSVLLSQFAETVLQSLRFGAPLTAALSALGSETRRERSALIETKIAKAPVIMLLPMGLLILPAMLLLVMGPVLLNIVQELA